jgi:hypothetical protein
MREGGITKGPTIAGEAGPELIIPLDKLRRQLSTMVAIGASETSFNKNEAYSDKYNQPSNNANVAKFGERGADYGYYQMNQMDVDDAVRLGVPRDVAQHLNGGGRFGTSSLAEQTGALHQYMTAKYTKQYGGDWEKFRQTGSKKWHGLSRAGGVPATQAYESAMGEGHLDVHVNAPAGTRVSATGGGVFNKVNMKRNVTGAGDHHHQRTASR